jgi:pimeloyl-ACP methyl ester carboxylesterase
MLVGIEPAREGSTTRNGVRVQFQVFGSGPRTIILLPTWSIVHSDFWRNQVPHLARGYSVVTFDGRGNGASDRPVDPNQYTHREFAADALAIMDKLGVATAAIASNSIGATWGLILAAEHPERIRASVFIAPTLPLVPPLPARAASLAVFNEPRETYEGWFKFNRHYWQADWPDFLNFFFSNCFTEPGSEAQIEHFFRMGLETTPAAITATADAPPLGRPEAVQLAGSVDQPMLVIHGDEDAVTPTDAGRELARLSNAELVILPGSGHEPQCRIPGQINALLEDFLGRHYPSDAASPVSSA